VGGVDARASNLNGMVRRRMHALAAAAVVLPLLYGCSSDSNPAVSLGDASSTADSIAPRTTVARTGACKPVPAQAAPPDWYPADLPLPPGSFPATDTESGPASEADSDAASSSGDETHRGFYVVNGTIDDFVAFTKTDWTAAGYALGRGEAEPGEAEGGFRKGDFGGSFRIRDVYCDASMTELLITYGKGTAPG
jgi:hypothetical protein